MAVRYFPKEIENHKEEWVAISHDDRLVGHGKKPEDAIASATAAGYSMMEFALLWVPDQWPGVLIV